MTKDGPLKPFKLLLIGDAGTGKTNILSRLIKNEFNSTYKPTNGVICENHTIIVDTQTIEMDIWDIGGQNNYHCLVNSVVKDVDGILLVYDISKPATFENVAYWLDIVTQFGNPKAMVKLVGNKSDLDRAIPLTLVEQFAAKWGVSFIEISALDPSNNIKMVFHEICIGINSTPENSDDLLFSTCGFISSRMIKNHPLENPSCNDTQQQPLQIVLIDIKSAADKKICCSEKPLDDPDLKYVAISYRWGELEETTIDTKVGYSAVITSFDLDDFYLLCQTMLWETDLKDMDYVWVDAICVDQTNQDKRKATIYQMSTIYEKAKYILAVPDLHMAHLKNTLKSNKDIMDVSNRYKHDIYNIIHGYHDRLYWRAENDLGIVGVPNDNKLTQLLNTFTDHFIDGFTTCRVDENGYDDEKTFDHIIRNIPILRRGECSRWDGPPRMCFDNWKQGLERLHHCHEENCPLDAGRGYILMCPESSCPIQTLKTNRIWEKKIQKRSTGIRRSIDFMADLIKDWANRVWVMSEYTIAKQKNNLKFWFIQLGNFNGGMDFFKFDYMNSAFYMAIQYDLDNFHHWPMDQRNNPIYLTFHQTMATQLNQKSVLEMMLKSKARKNEDRFYAIFPLTEYKNIILDKSEVSKWKIDTLTSVKIKLFQVLNTKDKLDLLFISGHENATFVGQVMPTFATSSIYWDGTTELFVLNDISDCNFDLDSSDTITFHHLDIPCINLKPKEYYIVENDDVVLPNPGIWNNLPCEANDIVCILIWTESDFEDGTRIKNTIWKDPCLYLNGNFKTNIWIIIPQSDLKYRNVTQHTIHDYNTGFNIY